MRAFGAFRQKVQVVFALGLINLLRVVAYRFGVKFGLNPVRRLRAEVPIAPFFKEVPNKTVSLLPAPSSWRHEVRYFGFHPLPVMDGPPDWHLNPMTGVWVNAPERPWWTIPDFDVAVGDIKTVWEASRFDWVLAFAQRVRSGEATELQRLNVWLADWSAKNPPYCGPNWKCGQEASIRVMHLCMVAMILGQTDQPSKGLVDLIRLHLQRIAPTISYSMAQDNNHGTSEAAALFIGGSWLAAQGVGEGEKWQKTGRKWLENRVARLIDPDGSFSQYSLNYHRMMLDTLSMVDVWRRHQGLAEFSGLYKSRSAAAARWLFAMVDPVSGDAPNLGANDGARLLPLTKTDYRDYRPSVQLGMALFTNVQAYAESGSSNSQLAWLGVALPQKVANPPGNQVFDGGGYVVLRRDKAMAVLRYPRFRFRPSQADALHLDLWHDGENLLRDAGSYSYNTDPEWLAYFPETAAHNTVQFDDRDQMPRLSRFLFGDWLKTESVQPLMELDEETTFGAAYRDGYGVKHQRSIRLLDNRIIVQDEVLGFTGKAVLRWRVKPGKWHLDGQNITDGKHNLSITSSVRVSRIELLSGWESRHYLQKTALPVLEIEIHEPGLLTMEYRW
jgi:Heparinase II/III-like protein/Heparinase II/III N-terminus